MVNVCFLCCCFLASLKCWKSRFSWKKKSCVWCWVIELAHYNKIYAAWMPVLETVADPKRLMCLSPWKAPTQPDREDTELTYEHMMQQSMLASHTIAASITVLLFTRWERLLGSSSPFSSERMDVWLWSHQPWTSEAQEKHSSSWVLRVPLIGDHVFVPDRLWNGVLLQGCVTPASHQVDWLVWSCGMFPSGPQ